ncbi:MAG TPA: efflux RND transporter permease subunit [Gemmatimonadaceae bacterium]|nr:efflux RND transporter permease subunit [Gemmatimonadaceae bacterium]
MLISDFAIKRPIITVVAMVALVVFGGFALVKLQTDEFPDIQNPIVNVAIAYPGASPDIVEREVLDRVEEAISGISGVDKIQGSATDGFASILVKFVYAKNIQEAAQDVRDKISTIRGDLPQEIEEPILSRFDPSDQPIVQLALTSSTLSSPDLTRIADPGILRELRGIPGVAQATVVGGVNRELTIYIEPEKLLAARVGVGEVVAAVQQQNLASPVGRIESNLEEKTIRLRGKLEHPEDFAQLVVAERNGRLIHLNEVARVEDGTADQRTLALFNGREAVGIMILKAKGYSTTFVANGVRAGLKKIAPTLPQGAHIEIVQDAGTRVTDSVANVQSALVEGAFLTVFVVFLFLNSWRSTVITGLALPVSVVSSFIAVLAFGFTLNTMSLLGLSLAIGILIDDAIVVRENIVRHIEMGKDHYTAAHDGTDQIGLAVTATTFSIVCVFIPIAFLQDEAGQWFKPFALTIACAVLVSLFVSFSLDPMLSAYWADPQIEKHERRNPISRLLDKFNTWFNHQTDRYARVIGWALDHRFAMALITVGSFVGALYLQGKFGGFGFVPVSDRSEIFIDVDTPPGSNLAYTRVKMEEVMRILGTHPEVAATFATIGGGSFDPYGGTAGGSVDKGQVYARLVRKDQRHISQDKLGAIIRKEVSQIGGATTTTYTSGFGWAVKQIQVQVRGREASQLQRIAEEMRDSVKTFAGAVDVGLNTKGQKPELDVQINRGLAGSLGINVAQVAYALRPAFAGIDAGDWVDPTGETRDVTVRLEPEARRRVSDLERLPLVLSSRNGGPPNVIPLGQLASIGNGVGPAQITHLDRDNVVYVQANTSGRSIGEINQDIKRVAAKITLPPGYSISMGGEVEDQQRVFTSILAALGLAVMLMYLVLVVQFGSFLDPVAIMISLPLSLIGVVLALIVTGSTLNIMSMIGVILLMGIVAKNAILLIDFAKWGREQGLDRRAAIIEAGRVRLRPILMTTLALIAGMIPVALGIGEGADFRAPLGRAVIGGTITSTLLTLLVIPTIYDTLDSMRMWVRRRLGIKPRPKTGEFPIPELAGD